MGRDELAQRADVSRVDGRSIGTQDTGNVQLQRKRPQEQVRQIPPEVMGYVPEQALMMDFALFTKCLQSAPSGVSAGPGGCTNEMLRVCLDDAEVHQLLFRAAEDFARRSQKACPKRSRLHP